MSFIQSFDPFGAYLSLRTETQFEYYKLSPLAAPQDTPVVTSLTLTGYGTGFTYETYFLDTGSGSGVELGPFLVAGLVDRIEVTATLSFPESFGVPGPVDFTVFAFNALDLDIAAANLSPETEIDFAEELSQFPLQFPSYDIEEKAAQITLTADGQIATAPAPMQVFGASQPLTAGGPGEDHFTFLDPNGLSGAVDVKAGDDFVTFVGDEGSLLVKLRRGDDLFIGDDFGIDGFAGVTTTVLGGVGNDLLFGGYGADTLRGGKDEDILLGLQGDDFLAGGAQDDFIFGGLGDDQLFGGVGKDVLNGGAGNNVLRGGLGSDVFWRESNISHIYDAQVGGTTTVLDFQHGIDKIYLSIVDLDILHTPQTHLQFFMGSSYQAGTDTVFVDEVSTLVLKNVKRDQITVNDFYDKPWLLIEEADAFAYLA